MRVFSFGTSWNGPVSGCRGAEIPMLSFAPNGSLIAASSDGSLDALSSCERERIDSLREIDAFAPDISQQTHHPLGDPYPVGTAAMGQRLLVLEEYNGTLEWHVVGVLPAPPSKIIKRWLDLALFAGHLLGLDEDGDMLEFDFVSG